MARERSRSTSRDHSHDSVQSSRSVSSRRGERASRDWCCNGGKPPIKPEPPPQHRQSHPPPKSIYPISEVPPPELFQSTHKHHPDNITWASKVIPHIMKDNENTIKMVIRRCNLNYSPSNHHTTNTSTFIDEENLLHFHIDDIAPHHSKTTIPITRQMPQFTLPTIQEIDPSHPKLKITNLTIVKRKFSNASYHKRHRGIYNKKVKYCTMLRQQIDFLGLQQ